MKVTVYTIFDQFWKQETLLLSSTFHSTTVKSLKLLLDYCRSQIYSSPFIKASVMYGTNREMSHFVTWRWVMSLVWVSCLPKRTNKSYLPDPDREDVIWQFENSASSEDRLYWSSWFTGLDCTCKKTVSMPHRFFGNNISWRSSVHYIWPALKIWHTYCPVATF